MAALLLATIAGHSAIAQAQIAAGSRAPAVAAPAPPSAQDIREIRGPKPIASPWLIPLVALSALVSGGGVWAAWAWYRRRSGLLLQTPVEIALARLEYARGLMRPELGRDFSIEVSSSVREYIERRFQVMAAHLTTHEFLQDSLGSHDPVLIAKRPLLAEFMESCDLAKFGGWTLSREAMEEMLQSARSFVLESMQAGLNSTPVNPTPTAATKTPPVTSRETYDSVPST